MKTEINTMIKQFGNKALVMIGGRISYYDDATNSIKIIFKAKSQYNSLLLTYDAKNDLYNMDFFKIKFVPHCEVVREKNITGIYADQMLSIFELVTGLRVSL